MLKFYFRNFCFNLECLSSIGVSLFAGAVVVVGVYNA